MATHEIKIKLVLHLDDGTSYPLPFPKKVYYYYEQKHNYWVCWIEEFLAKHPEIRAKPVRIEEVNYVEECIEYAISIGL